MRQYNVDMGMDKYGNGTYTGQLGMLQRDVITVVHYAVNRSRYQEADLIMMPAEVDYSTTGIEFNKFALTSAMSILQNVRDRPIVRDVASQLFSVYPADCWTLIHFWFFTCIVLSMVASNHRFCTITRVVKEFVNQALIAYGTTVDRSTPTRVPGVQMVLYGTLLIGVFYFSENARNSVSADITYQKTALFKSLQDIERAESPPSLGLYRGSFAHRTFTDPKSSAHQLYKKLSRSGLIQVGVEELLSTCIANPKCLFPEATYILKEMLAPICKFRQNPLAVVETNEVNYTLAYAINSRLDDTIKHLVHKLIFRAAEHGFLADELGRRGILMNPDHNGPSNMICYERDHLPSIEKFRQFNINHFKVVTKIVLVMQVVALVVHIVARMVRRKVKPKRRVTKVKIVVTQLNRKRCNHLQMSRN